TFVGAESTSSASGFDIEERCFSGSDPSEAARCLQRDSDRRASLAPPTQGPTPASSPPRWAPRRTGRTFRKISPTSFVDSRAGCERLVKLLFQCGAGGSDLGEEFFIFQQKVVHVTGAGVGVVRVLEVEVIVAGFD